MLPDKFEVENMSKTCKPRTEQSWKVPVTINRISKLEMSFQAFLPPHCCNSYNCSCCLNFL